MELDLRLGHSTQKPLVSFINKIHNEPLIQLDLMPFAPVQRHSPPPHDLRFQWLTREKMLSDTPTEEGEDAASSIHMDCSRMGKRNRKFTNIKVETDQRGGTSSRGSDEEDNTLGRKKLRLSKEQSNFLEQSFNERHTLNPKHKLTLAKQLSLRPRQVEVWFQNRRARTKLKQTEIDCEYLRRYCETLREENRRLQKEIQELRALNNTNTIINPFPITTLTMCPSCERVATSTTTCSLTSLAC